jgi:hypothetical protein
LTFNRSDLAISLAYPNEEEGDISTRSNYFLPAVAALWEGG